MNCETISLLPDLERASDTRKPNVCKTWQNVIQNENGLFNENVKTFERHKAKKHVIINAGIIYPKVYFSFEVSDGSNFVYKPLTRYSENFNVHDHPANIMLMVEHALRGDCYNFKLEEELISGAIDDMNCAITEE